MKVIIQEYKDVDMNYSISKKYRIENTGKYIRKTSCSSNCQLDSIGLAHNLLKFNNEKVHIILTEVFKYCKPLLLLDIKQSIRKDLERIFLKYNYKKHRIMNYISANNSEMCIIILKKI